MKTMLRKNIGFAMLTGSILGCSTSDTSKRQEEENVNIVVDADGDGYLEDEDCNDNDGSVYLGASEICDGVDNNCDGEIDEGVMDTFYADNDEDGFGDPDNSLASCSSPEGYVDTPNDCNDSSANAFPGNNEICDDLDNNCDGEIDEGIGYEYFLDEDGDGYGLAHSSLFSCDYPQGYAQEVGDCDDDNALVYPNAYEVCDEIDNNCDGSIDTDALNASRFYVDFDEDGFGNPSSPIYSCTMPEGTSENRDDCNDVDTAIHPDAYEICDTQDNNCNGLIDEEGSIDAASWYADADADGYGTSSSVLSCTQPAGFTALSGDCDDTTAAATPVGTEICDGIDNNCDGSIDEGLIQTWYLDYDGDGFGGTYFTQESCTQPSSYVSDNTDCNDLSALSYVGAEEICDGIDNDCDGSIDNDASGVLTLFEDSDGDGYGSTTSIESCTLLVGYSEEEGDCDDGDIDTAPNASELCDGADNDCDGSLDNGLLGSGVLCPAESCLEILDNGSSVGSGSYWINWDGDITQYRCDMNTSGGGWTATVDWDRENSGDNWAELRNEMTELYNNMSEQDTGGSDIRWSDYNSTADVMVFEKLIPFDNQGEILLDINYYGFSMENSAIYFFGETASDYEDILCRDDTFSNGYNSIEIDYVPYDCATSANASWTWNDIYLSTLSDSVSALHFRAFQYDGGGGDRSYLYHLTMWVR